MRELIRPTLFMTARTGLFLAVVAWIVGRVVGQEAIYGFYYSVLCIRLTADGWEAGIVEMDKPLFCGRIQLLIPAPHPGLGPSISLLFNHGMGLWFVFIRHWLVVTLFTAFNVALHFIYRKHPEVQPCEA